mmetsp:Transcript_122688/g.192565  ORF Transcript_122688/g.192565 Transcript_122688/m.192565 type:complete len:263 (-) Transcript_122688:12-800(-)
MLAAALRQVSPPRPHALELETAMRYSQGLLPDSNVERSTCASENRSGIDFPWDRSRFSIQQHPKQTLGNDNVKERLWTKSTCDVQQTQQRQSVHSAMSLEGFRTEEEDPNMYDARSGGPVRLSLSQMLGGRATFPDVYETIHSTLPDERIRLDDISPAFGLTDPGMLPPKSAHLTRARAKSEQNGQYLATPAPHDPRTHPPVLQTHGTHPSIIGYHIMQRAEGSGSPQPPRSSLSRHIAGEDPSAVKEDFLATPLPFVGVGK